MTGLEVMPQESIFSLKKEKNIVAQVRFPKLHLNNPQDCWNDVLWTDEYKVEMSGRNAPCYVWRKEKKKCAKYYSKHIIQTVKNGGGGGTISRYRSWPLCGQ